MVHVAGAAALLCVTSVVAGARAPEKMIDLSRATVVVPAELGDPEVKAVALLVDEVEKRTGLRLPVGNVWPTGRPVIAVGPASALKAFAGRFGERLAAEKPLEGREGYRLRVEAGASAVLVVGNDARGVLFGVGRLLRALVWERGHLSIAAGLSVYTVPRVPVRMHQIGPIGAHDGWSASAAQQYVRDLAVFGANGIELDAGREAPGTPEALAAVARVASGHGLQVSLSYPVPETDGIDRTLASVDAVIARLARLDAVVVRAGQGRKRPKAVLAFAEKLAATARKRHGKVQVWVVPGGFPAEDQEELLVLLGKEPVWLSGIVHGAGLLIPSRDFGRRMTGRLLIRLQPDVTHTLHAQYPIPDWDLAFALTTGAAPINPRPLAMAHIVRTLRHAPGFVTRSEGANDDINKVVWTALAWDGGADVMELLRQYGRYFVGPAHDDAFAQALVALERNWNAPLLTNEGVYATLRQVQALEQQASAGGEPSWRLQQMLFRAYADAYTRQRLLYETALEDEALAKLRAAGMRPGGGGLAAIEQAEAILDRAVHERPASEWRARLAALVDVLHQRGVPTGTSLVHLDVPLNNRGWIKQRLAEIRKRHDEADRLKALDEILGWSDPGPGGFYDNLGCPGAQPRVVGGLGVETDPAFLESPRIGFALDRAGQPWDAQTPRSWWDSAETVQDVPLVLRYTGLDRRTRYRVRVVYGGRDRTNEIRLLADEKPVHPPLDTKLRRLEFDVPAETTRDGEVLLSFSGPRGAQVAEIWLAPVPRGGRGP